MVYTLTALSVNRMSLKHTLIFLFVILAVLTEARVVHVLGGSEENQPGDLRDIPLEPTSPVPNYGPFTSLS